MIATIPGTPKIAIVSTVNVLIENIHPLSFPNTFMKNNIPIVKDILNIRPVLLSTITLEFNFLPIYIIKSSEQRMAIYQVNPSPFHQSDV